MHVRGAAKIFADAQEVAGGDRVADQQHARQRGIIRRSHVAFRVLCVVLHALRDDFFARLPGEKSEGCEHEQEETKVHGATGARAATRHAKL